MTRAWSARLSAGWAFEDDSGKASPGDALLFDAAPCLHGDAKARALFWLFLALKTGERAEWDAYVRDLGHELAKGRRVMGLSQDAAAAAAGLARSQYQRLERGQVSRTQSANPTLATLLAVSQVLDATICDLLPTDAPDMRAGRTKAEW